MPVFVKFVKKEAKRFPNCLRLPRGIPADPRRSAVRVMKGDFK